MSKEITAPMLYRNITEEKDFFLFDVRNAEDFQQGHIEGKKNISSINIPYFTLIEEGGKEDAEDSIATYATQQLIEKLPKTKPILVVCAKGGSSALVADVLGSLGYDAQTLAGGMQHWAEYYDTKSVAESDNLTIIQVIRPSRGCLSYVVISQKEAAIIDPLRNEKLYLDLLEEKEASLKYILDTHVHADHISGGKGLASRTGAPYFFHPYDGIHPMDMLPATFFYHFSWADRIFPLGNCRLQALHIPGHTLGNQAFLLNNDYLFSGDSLFLESIARPDLGGQAASWTTLHYHSLRKILLLSDHITLLPAHFSRLSEADTRSIFQKTLGECKRDNEGLQMATKSEKEFREYILSSLPTFPEEYIEIKRVNIGLSHPNEERTQELEIGKNICALAKKG